MKKINKKNDYKFLIYILVFISGVALSSSISYAAVKYTSKDVTFTPSNSNWKVSNVDSALTSLYGLAGSFGVVPVGTINSMMGNTPPDNYLICDGTVYKISDYPALAEYFKNELGSSNYFGGDGSTTFAVPDLRGEFLRGSGTNSHTNQGNGANVGVHQDGTIHSFIGANNKSGNVTIGIRALEDSSGFDSYNFDAKSIISHSRGYSNMSTTSANEQELYTSRPTNTSVLYVIASKDIYVEGKVNYSTEEQVVGTWIDGKPLYQKTFNYGALPNNTYKDYPVGDMSVDSVINISGIALSSTEIKPLPYSHADSAAPIMLDFRGNNTNNPYIRIYTKGNYSGFTGYVTIQYTKTTD